MPEILVACANMWRLPFGPCGRRLLAALALSCFAPGAAFADTISAALARAYGFNPELNAQRAFVRATDENLPAALSGYRPTITATADFGAQLNSGSSSPRASTENGATFPQGTQLRIEQNLWNGNRTLNGVRRAGSEILTAREALRLAEQNVLLNSATAYMNVLRDTAILALRRNNVAALQLQLDQTRGRYDVGDVTRTDVAQAESSLAQGRAAVFTAEANLQTSIANYRQITGVAPVDLKPARALDSLLPKTASEALTRALDEHPFIKGALHDVDVAQLNVQIIQGQLAPTVGITGGLGRQADGEGQPGVVANSGAATAFISAPLYEGGAVYAAVRQAKEVLAQVRQQADVQRALVRAQALSAWSIWSVSSSVIAAAEAQVSAADVALTGVREEAKVGQRTTLNVLNAQQVLLNARVQVVTAQRDRVVASYALLAATGQLSAARLGLRVVRYDPIVHEQQVKRKWIGTRTPDGR